LSVDSHLEELKKKHKALSDEVKILQRAPGADDLELQHLKKCKLHLKQEISRLSRPLVSVKTAAE
jgi:hypothetical protein